jgi:hypothetical protein
MIQQALQNLRPGAQWSLDGETYNGLIWHDESEPPTQEEVESEIERIRPIFEYQEKRRREYPSVVDQLDMIFHDFDGWKKMIQTVKDKFPKPAEPLAEE